MKAKSSSTDWFLLEDICVNEIIINGSDNGLSPSRRQAIIWTNAGILLIGPLGTNFSEILIGIHTFSFKKMHLKWKMRAILSRPQCVNVPGIIPLPSDGPAVNTSRLVRCLFRWRPSRLRIIVYLPLPSVEEAKDWALWFPGHNHC